MFTNRYYIRELSTDGVYYQLLREGLQNAVAVDFDSVENKLYYIDVQGRQIQRMDMNGSNPEKLVTLRFLTCTTMCDVSKSFQMF